MEKKIYIISVFTENHPGMLQRVVSAFTRRNINIISLTTSKSAIPDVHKFIILLKSTEDSVRKVTINLGRQVDIVKSFYYQPEDTVMQEIALYKVATKGFLEDKEIEKLIREHNAKILSIDPNYVVIEKTGLQSETEEFLQILRPHGVHEFVRSGIVAVTKDHDPLKNYLEETEKQAIINKN